MRSIEYRGSKVIQYHKTVRARDKYDDTRLTPRQTSRTVKTYSSTKSKKNDAGDMLKLDYTQAEAKKHQGL